MFLTSNHMLPKIFLFYYCFEQFIVVGFYSIYCKGTENCSELHFFSNYALFLQTLWRVKSQNNQQIYIKFLNIFYTPSVPFFAFWGLWDVKKKTAEMAVLSQVSKLTDLSNYLTDNDCMLTLEKTKLLNFLFVQKL